MRGNLEPYGSRVLATFEMSVNCQFVHEGQTTELLQIFVSECYVIWLHAEGIIHVYLNRHRERLTTITFSSTPAFVIMLLRRSDMFR